MWNVISLVQDWTRVAVFISYDDNNYTMGTSKCDQIMLRLILTSWIQENSGISQRQD